MKSLFVNTVLGTTLAAALAVVGLGVVSDTLFQPHYPEEPAYPVELGGAEAPTAGEAAPEAEPDIALLLASASIEAGAKLTAQCTACHVFEQGGASGVGPFLWSVYGRPAGEVPGFNYSAAMAAFDQTWTAETLNAFLTAPKKYIEGTAMSYAGMKKAQDRANLIAYLHSLNPAAPALPVAAEPAPVEASPEAAQEIPGTETTPPVPAAPESPAGAQPG